MKIKAKSLFNDQMCVVGNRRNKIAEKWWVFKFDHTIYSV